jgi:phosphatidylinositol 4-kinase
LGQSVHQLRTLINGLFSAFDTDIESTPSSSSGSDGSGVGTVAQAQLCEGLLKAVIWVAWGSKDDSVKDDVENIIVDIFDRIKALFKGNNIGQYTAHPCTAALTASLPTRAPPIGALCPLHMHPPAPPQKLYAPMSRYLAPHLRF